jgi:flagellin
MSLLRINNNISAADLIVSEHLRSDISGIRAAIRNSQEASNLIGIAEGALQEISNMLTSMRGLVIHASNTGVVSAEQIAADQQEVDNALATIDRVAATTRFGGDPIFAKGSAIFQVGEGGTSDDQVGYTFVMVNTSALGIGSLDVTNSTAIADIEGAISVIASMRGDLGAFQKNTLQTNMNSLTVTLENVTATESFIRDANMAEETSNFTKQQILVQAGVSVLAQANVLSQSVLQLLQ